MRLPAEVSKKSKPFSATYAKFALVISLLTALAACNRQLDTQLPTGEPLGGPTSVTFETRVVNRSDDAEEHADGSVHRSSSDLELVRDASDQTIGIRFAAVNIPPGATITNAYLQFKVDEVSSEPTNLTIRGQAADNPQTFSSTTLGITTRPTTNAFTTWSPPAWNTVGEQGPNQRTPNLSTVVQEIINRNGWASGNAMTFIITGSGKRVAESFNGDAAGAPLLHIEYELNVVINTFSAAPNPTNIDQTVTFNWSVTTSNAAPVSCELDADGDGTPEYFIQDCISTTSQTHSYPNGGFFTAKLTATDGTNLGRASTPITVFDPSTVTVAGAGDIACDPNSSKFNGGEGTSSNCHMKAVADMMAGMQLAAVLPLGDVQYEDGAFDKFMQSYDPSWGRFKNITYPAVGNHEYKTPGAAGYYQYFGNAAGDPTQGYYSYDLGGWHIIVLNTQCSQVGGCSVWSPQGRWLSADLETHPSLCTLAYWHIPLFSSGGRANQNAKSFWQLLQGAGVELVLSGHDHLYERFTRQDANGVADPNGIRSFIVGTGGKNHTSIAGLMANSEVWNDDTYGVLKLTLRPDGYDWEFVPEPGWSFTDSGSDSCH